MKNQVSTLKPRLLLIEDDAERIVLFRKWVATTPFVLIEATSGGQAMGVVNRGSEGVAGIMLDHDLNTSPKTLQDQITSGSNVVASIIKHIPKTVPVLVHSMNITKGEQMFRRLQGSGFSATRIRMAALDERRFLHWLEDVSESWEDRYE
jgi:hypothetical protein